MKDDFKVIEREGYRLSVWPDEGHMEIEEGANYINLSFESAKELIRDLKIALEDSEK